jgi:hypothetical protein
MNGCGFFEDQPRAGSLPSWATITQVSNFLEVPRNAVRSAVRRAVESQEAWVKKEMTEDGRAIYLIDTTHQTYQAHEERWKQSNTIRGKFLWQTPPWCLLCLPRQEERCSLELAHESVGSERPCWPQVQRWLAVQGLELFINQLAREEGAHPWHWRWGELHGEGYQNEEEALVAALQSRFEAHEREREEGNALLQHLLEQEERPAPARFGFFFRRRTSPAF